MFRNRIISNKCITRTLRSALSPEVLNKPKKTKWHNDYMKYPFIYSFDRPRYYLDLNSRLITVEGNIGVGKEKIARKIADYFGLQFVDDVFDDELYMYHLGDNELLDMREFNTCLPRTAKIYTREMFWTDDNPIKYGKPLLLQINHYNWRYYKLCIAMAHLMNTGQGIATNRSPFTDNVMALTMTECGLMSKPAYKYYNLMRCESLPNIWRPNIIVYLKASPTMIRQKLNEKNGWEKNAHNISDKFIETYTDILENKYLKNEEIISKIFTIDLEEHNVDDEDDFTALMESMAKLNVEFKGVYDFDSLHLDWRNGTHSPDICDFSRTYFSSVKQSFSKSLRHDRIPYKIREGAYSEDELEKIHRLLSNDERFVSQGASPRFNSLTSLIFRWPKFNFANLHHSPYEKMKQSFY